MDELTDYERLKELLQSIGCGFREDTSDSERSLSLEGSMAKVDAPYHGASFVFTSNSKFKEVHIGE